MTKRMQFTFLLISIVLLLFGCQPESSDEPSRGPFVIRNGTVITATGVDPIANGAVVIADGVIMDVGPEAEIEIPDGAQVIDAGGGTILPGLIDTHVHVLNYLQIEDGEIANLGLEAHLRGAIRAGVTTLWDVGSSYGERAKLDGLRAALAAHGDSIPAVIVTGHVLSHADGAFASTWPKNTIGVTSVEEAQASAQGLVDAGVDHIKIALTTRPFATAPVGDPPEEISPSLSEDMIRAIVDVAHANGLRVTAHVLDLREAVIALAAGVDVFAHWPSSTQPFPDEVLQMVADAGVPIVGTFTVVQPIEGDMRRFLDAGGSILYGTDGPPAGALKRTRREFDFMHKEMSPMEMILAATAHAARALGLEDQIGTLAPGLQADIIIVGGDLLEDFSAIEDVKFVFNNGALVVQPDDR